ncbi:hypothetical protein KC725_03535 [Candidatus Peregrinibacteria bacterium]|nr:hypothetical protein [Candidatus Peregrinibacteria bacterium]
MAPACDVAPGWTEDPEVDELCLDVSILDVLTHFDLARHLKRTSSTSEPLRLEGPCVFGGAGTLVIRPVDDEDPYNLKWEVNYPPSSLAAAGETIREFLGAGGTVVEFVMRLQSCGHSQAIAVLKAIRANGPIDSVSSWVSKSTGDALNS